MRPAVAVRRVGGCVSDEVRKSFNTKEQHLRTSAAEGGPASYRRVTQTIVTYRGPLASLLGSAISGDRQIRQTLRTRGSLGERGLLQEQPGSGSPSSTCLGNRLASIAAKGDGTRIPSLSVEFGDRAWALCYRICRTHGSRPTRQDPGIPTAAVWDNYGGVDVQHHCSAKPFSAEKRKNNAAATLHGTSDREPNLCHDMLSGWENPCTGRTKSLSRLETVRASEPWRCLFGWKGGKEWVASSLQGHCVVNRGIPC